jgi:hypothetical protein
MALDIEEILIFVGGCVISGFCALHWRRRRYLHLVPFGYSFVIDIFFRTSRGIPLEWQAPLFFGVVFYLIGWIAAYSRMKHAG